VNLHFGRGRGNVVIVERHEEVAQGANQHDEVHPIVELVSKIGDLDTQLDQVLVHETQQQLLHSVQLCLGSRLKEVIKHIPLRVLIPGSFAAK